MNLFDSSFLCLDVGTAVVRGIAHCVRGARIVRSAVATAECDDTPVAAIMAVVDNLEHQMATRFTSAFVTGNFGDVVFDITARQTKWHGPHKIVAADVRDHATKIGAPDGFHPMHIIPLRYDGINIRNMATPIGQVDTALMSVFGVISYSQSHMSHVFAALRRAHIQTDGIFDSMFLLATAMRPKRQTIMILDMGASYTTASIWTPRGPVAMVKIARGQSEIIKKISETFDIGMTDAARVRGGIPINVTDMDRFTPADALFGFSRADVADVINPVMMDILGEIRNNMAAAMAKYAPATLMICGGGSDIDGINDLVAQMFSMPIQNIGSDATLRALSDTVWDMQTPRIVAYNARRDRIDHMMRRITRIFQPGRRPNRPRGRAAGQIPILPSTLAFDMRDPMTYTMFQSAGISMIHVDIMDGFFVDRVTGSIDDLCHIRANTRAHLSVHLMTESPAHWAADAIAAGADTVIVSAGAAGVRDAIGEIRRRGRRVGIAISPDTSLTVLKPILRQIDVVLVMSVRPGAGGQEFIPNTLGRIATLAATRKKYGLKFEISVDGGINNHTAPGCWGAGADTLVSGSYLAQAADFPLAVQNLLKRRP